MTAVQHVVEAHGVTIFDSGFAAKLDTSTLGTSEGVFTLLRTLALVAVLLSTHLILNTVTTLVAEQTPVIGSMKALRGTRGVIVRGCLISVGIYAVLATLPALALGLYPSNQLALALAPQIPLTLGPFAVAPWVVALSIAVDSSVPLLAALVPLWNGTRVSVREVISAYGVSIGAAQGQSVLA